MQPIFKQFVFVQLFIKGFNINFSFLTRIYSCTEANLNGIYRDTPRGHNYNGIVWEHWLGDYSLKSAKMMIRPRDLWFNDDGTDVFLESPDDP